VRTQKFGFSTSLESYFNHLREAQILFELYANFQTVILLAPTLLQLPTTALFDFGQLRASKLVNCMAMKLSSIH
jgi:hypothetical protein